MDGMAKDEKGYFNNAENHGENAPDAAMPDSHAKLKTSATWGFPTQKDIHPTSTSSGTTLVDRTDRSDWPEGEELESLGMGKD